MQLYSKETNVYVQAKAPLNTCSPPAVKKAEGVINKEAIPLDTTYAEECKKRITEDSLKADYKNAISYFNDMLLVVFQILNAKGGLTQNEWELIKSSITKTKFMFPDIVLEIGTRQPWTIEKGSEDEFIRDLLRNHGDEVKIIPESNGEFLFTENPKEFLDQMYVAFGINTIFRDIENAIDKRGKDSGYGKTKKKLYYITIYDFLKYHLNIEGKPSVQEMIQALYDCKDKNSGEIIAIRDSLLPKIKGDFWAEYDKYLEFKYIEVLVYWFSKSKTRSLNGEAYKFFEQAVGESTLQRAMQYLKVHTAFLDQKRVKVKTQKNTAFYSGLTIHNPGDELYATICLGGYAESFKSAKRTDRLSAIDSLSITNLEFGKTYYVSIWEVANKDDALKLGDLPSVTPGIQWPVRKDIRKNMISDILHITLIIEQPDASMAYSLCIKKGNSFINSLRDGQQYKPCSNSTSTEIRFEIPDLIYEEEYTFCIYVTLDNGKFFNKLQQDIRYIPHKLRLTPVIFKPGTATSDVKEIGLEFEGSHWPKDFSDDEIVLACRFDAYPETDTDSDSNLIIPHINQNNYKEGMFKIRTTLSKLEFQTLYICGWINRGSGLVEQVIKNSLYRIDYSVKLNEISLINFDAAIIDLPVLRLYIFDRNHSLIYSDENVRFHDGKYKGTWGRMNHFRAKYYQLEPNEANLRLVYKFENR